MPSIALNCEPASPHSTRTSPRPPCIRGQSPLQYRPVAPAAALSVSSQPPTQLPRFAGYNQVASSGGFLTTPLEQYRLQLYNYAVHMERLRCPHYSAGGQQLLPSAAAAVAAFSYTNVAAAAAAAAAIRDNGSNSSYQSGSRLELSMSLFPQRIFQPEEPKPQHSYIGLIAMAILSSVETKLVLSDIYQYILDNYPYFRTRGPGWRNSIRHNLSLNDCFVKSGRSANGKGHFWAIHPANIDDFRKGDFRRRKAQRKVRKHMGLSVDDEGSDSPSPPPLPVTSPPPHHLPHYNHHLSSAQTHLGYLQQQQQNRHHVPPFHQHHQHYEQSFVAAAAAAVTATPTSTHYVSSADVSLETPHNTCNNKLSIIKETTTTTASVIANLYSQTRKRQFDVASLLAPDVEVDVVDDTETIERATGCASATTTTTTTTRKRTLIAKLSVQQQHHHQLMSPYVSKQNAHSKLTTQGQSLQNLSELDEQEDIDVVASDVENDVEGDEAGDEIDEVVEELDEEEEENHMSLISNQQNSDQSQNLREVKRLEENINTNSEIRNLPQYSAKQISVKSQQHSNEVRSANNISEPAKMDDDYHNNRLNCNCNNSQQSPAEPQKQQQQTLQRSMHHLPTELTHVDPRIFGCYYGTYMAAAAAAQHVTARRISKSIRLPLAAAAPSTSTATAAESSSIIIAQQQKLQNPSYLQQLNNQQTQRSQN